MPVDLTAQRGQRAPDKSQEAAWGRCSCCANGIARVLGLQPLSSSGEARTLRSGLSLHGAGTEFRMAGVITDHVGAPVPLKAM